MESLIVLRKEMLELLASRHTRRGALAQAGIMAALTGIVVPWMDPRLLGDVSASVTLFFIFPSVLAATVAADAFAGERERKTLETLLATPLHDRAIFLGKVANAISFAWAVSIVSLALGVLTTNVKQGFDPVFHPPLEQLAGLLGGSLAASSLTAAIATIVSSRIAVARGAQQVAQLISLALAFGTSTMLQRLGVPIEWPLIMVLDAVLFGLAIVALSVAIRLFQRDRLFESR